jgi:hypothetical protein
MQVPEKVRREFQKARKEHRKHAPAPDSPKALILSGREYEKSSNALLRSEVKVKEVLK